jgi:hypothetical protein
MPLARVRLRVLQLQLDGGGRNSRLLMMCSVGGGRVDSRAVACVDAYAYSLGLSLGRMVVSPPAACGGLVARHHACLVLILLASASRVG